MSNVSPIYALNNYIWKVLQMEAGWSTSQYGGKTPIIPSAQQPEFMQYTAPHIVYGYAADTGRSDLWVLETEQAAYTIYASTATDANKALRVLNPALRRMDETAHDVNVWIHSPSNPLNGSFVGISFQYVTLAHMAGPAAPVQEGGRVDALFVVRYGVTAPTIADKEFNYTT